MPNLLDIRRRIKSVKNTQQITKAMKMVSAAKLKRAQDRVVTARPFANKMMEVLGELAGRTTQELFNSCVTTEQKAQTALVAAWKDIPATYKERCIKPNAYSPSYAEWIGCLELLIQVKNLPKD